MMFPSIKTSFSSRFNPKFHRSWSKEHVYVIRKGDVVFYQYNLTKKKMKPFVADFPIVGIFSLCESDFIHCQNGYIYTIFKKQTESPRSSVVSFGGSTSSGSSVFINRVQRKWTAAKISNERKIRFSEERSRVIVPLRGGLAVLCEDLFSWSLKIFAVNSDLRIHSKPTYSLLVTKSPQVSTPLMFAFRCGDNENDEETLNSALFESIFDEKGDKKKAQGILIAIESGQMYAVLLRNEIEIDSKDRIFKCVPFFCFHEPIVSICKSSKGLLVVGINGKIVIFTENDRFELKVQGPVDDFSGIGFRFVHLSGSSLWSSVLSRSDDGEIGIETIKLPIESVSVVKLCSNYDDSDQISDPFVVVFTNDGRFVVVTSFDKMEGPKKYDDKFTLNELLTDILRTSEILATVSEEEADRKRTLNELSRAARLMFDERVQSSFKVTTKADWPSYGEADFISVTSVLDSTQFELVEGPNWHFVVTIRDASKHTLTKSTPLLNGLGASNTVTSVTRLSCGYGCSFVDGFFPIVIKCILQYQLSSTTIEANSFSFHTLLNESVIDELNFLVSPSSAVSVISNSVYSELSLEDSLRELALRRSARSLENTRLKKRPNSFQVDYGYVECVSFRSSSSVLNNVIGCSKNKPISNRDLCEKVLSFLVAKSMKMSSSGGHQLECLLFGHKVKLTVVTIVDWLVTIKIETSEPRMNFNLKTAVIRMFNRKDFENKEKNEEDEAIVSVSRSVIADCIAIQSALNCSNVMNRQLHKELRNNVSSKLPFC